TWCRAYSTCMASRSPPAIRDIRTSSEVVCIAEQSARAWVAWRGTQVQAKSRKFVYTRPCKRQFPLFWQGWASRLQEMRTFTRFDVNKACQAARSAAVL